MTERLCGGAIFRTPHGGIVLQEREDLPYIDWPGMVHVFGGAAEDDEDGRQAMMRELQEETGLDETTLKSAIFLGREREPLPDSDLVNIVDMYLIPSVELSALQVLEGEAHVEITQGMNVEGLRLTGLAKTVLANLGYSVRETRR